MIVLDEAASGRTVDVPVGHAVELRLKENPATGFAWHVVTSGAPACRIAGDHFEAPASSVPGRPGTHSWTIESVAAGQCVLAFAYARAWERGGQPANTYTLTLNVSG